MHLDVAMLPSRPACWLPQFVDEETPIHERHRSCRSIPGGWLVRFRLCVLADLLKPKSFAGLFGAAPAIALATLSLTIGKEGASYAALEARSMIGGAFAFYVYACCVGRGMARATYSAKTIAFALLPVWFIIAAGFEIAIR
jgi:hypothetical protein